MPLPLTAARAHPGQHVAAHDTARRRTGRIASMDALRGLVILFMLLDHVRETFYLHHQVADPMAVDATAPGLFFSRLLAHLCAPVFVFLAGLSAFLYGARQPDPQGAASAFLFKRGLFLVTLELTVMNFAWTFQFPPATVYLQVIWAIGLSMVALAALVWLPRPAVIALGLLLVGGHNLLDGVHFPAGHALHMPWAVLHERAWLELEGVMRLRTSYPVLPWVGVIALGYAAGPWFVAAADAALRRRRLLVWGGTLLAGFVLLRALDVYGERPWAPAGDALRTAMAFLNVTKYPPSLLFVMLTLGVGLLLLRALEGRLPPRVLAALAAFGGAPMFFYVLHLFVLKLLYLAALGLWGANHGALFGFDALWMVWLTTAALAVALYPAARWFGALKARRRDVRWLKYL